MKYFSINFLFQTRFKDQLEVQDILLTVGKKLKETHQKDGVAMQAELPTALKSSNVDKRAFIPITNPRCEDELADACHG